MVQNIFKQQQQQQNIAPAENKQLRKLWVKIMQDAQNLEEVTCSKRRTTDSGILPNVDRI